jgi:hypothetical protein
LHGIFGAGFSENPSLPKKREANDKRPAASRWAFFFVSLQAGLESPHHLEN